MCNPVLIAGAVLMVAATAMNMVANEQVKSARNDALAAERIRQDGFNRQAESMVDESRDRYKDFDAKREGRSKELADYFAPANTNTTAAGVMPDSSSSITIANEKGARSKAGTEVKQQADSLGDLRSFGDLFGDSTRGQAGDAARIGMIGSFKRGSQAVLPLELDQANSAGDTLKMFGSLVGGAGKMMVSGGLGMAPPSLGGNLGGMANAAVGAMGVAGGSRTYGGPR